MNRLRTADELLQFWFSPETQPRWFDATPQFDDMVAERAIHLWRAAALGRLADWEQRATGAVALVIVLDQLPLNMFRDTPASFSTEAASRAVAERAIASGFDHQLEDAHRGFLYMPYMHSESLTDQDRSVALFESFGGEENARWALHHREIVRQFGRFPHRNAILGRPSTDAEIAWLQSDAAFSG